MGSLTCHFGIGASTVIEELIVYWPSGISDTLTDLNINETILIKENESNVVVDASDILEDKFLFHYNQAQNSIVLPNAEPFLGNIYFIYDIQGKVIHQNTLTQPEINIGTPLSTGTYVFSLKSNGIALSKKFVVK